MEFYVLAHLEPVKSGKISKLRSAHFMAVCAALVGDEIFLNGNGKCLGHIFKNLSKAMGLV
ncbi:MAG: hypothetical protein CM15mP8_4070 [Methanobacteriota archaeon]|nr:MAG: hypothetical protein CM15mP8_4070 [Euryarchaeota archaeon]